MENIWLILTTVLVTMAATDDANPVRHGLCLWLDASDAKTVEMEDNAVVLWRDKSGRDNDAAASGQPLLISDALNGKNVIRFSGKEYLRVESYLDTKHPITAFVVSRRTEEQADGPQWQRLLSTRTGKLPDNKPPYFCLTGTRNGSGEAYPPTVYVMTESEVKPAPLGIGAAVGSEPLNHAFRGDIAEVLVYERGFLTEDALFDVLEYLAGKWGAEISRRDLGWTRTEPIGEIPARVTHDLPLSDQQNEGGWVKMDEFSDEFDGDSLDETKWVSPYRWKGRPPALFVRSNVTVSDGMLHLAMRKEHVPYMDKDEKFHDYTSAWVGTQKLTRYGYFEVMARPMNSAGSSSFWFNHGNRNWWIEIDVYEIGGKVPGKEHHFNMNAHVHRENGVNDHWNTGGSWKAPWLLADDFHVYGFEWTPERIRYYVDGVVVRSVKNTHWHKPMRMIFDSETMPDWLGMPKDEDLPSVYSIEYVRAWKKPDMGGALTEEEVNAGSW